MIGEGRAQLLMAQVLQLELLEGELFGVVQRVLMMMVMVTEVMTEVVAVVDGGQQVMVMMMVAVAVMMMVVVRMVMWVRVVMMALGAQIDWKVAGCGHFSALCVFFGLSNQLASTQLYSKTFQCLFENTMDSRLHRFQTT